MRNTILEALSDNIVIDQDKCVYCGLCVDTCIMDNLRLKLAPCRAACPLGVNCQGYVQLILRGEDDNALEMVERNLPFPSILGRICSAQCETGCHHNNTDGSPVAIKALKRFLADKFDQEKLPLPEMEKATGKHICVVGSGPAGMLSAWDLLVKGHKVTMLDSDSEPGGMLRWAIPEFRLPTDTLKKEFARLAEMGMAYEGNKTLGKDYTVDELESKYDAVVLATGCPNHNSLSMSNEDASGVYHALPFLRGVRAGEKPEVGENVVVIGGGDVALDACQTALRLGAKKVTACCLESSDIMPATKDALTMAQKEGVEIACSWGPKAIKAENGKVTGITLQRCASVFNDKGAFAPCFDESIVEEMAIDTLIFAVGQSRDLSALGVSELQVKSLSQQTEKEKVFVAGDVLSGPSTVVEAMASGREAAESAHRLVMGEHLTYGRAYPGPVETDFDIDTSRAQDVERFVPSLKTYKGQDDFSEIEETMTEDQARKEASRCYSCGKPFGKYRTCWFCLPCEVECPKDALWVDIPYLLR